MKKLLIIFMTIALIPSKVFSQEVPVITFDDLREMMDRNEDTLYIFNFWATWCSPCVEELPYFNEISKTYINENVQVILVCLDFPSQLENKVLPFIAGKHLQPKIVLLDQPRGGKWIDEISPEWSGAIPGTLFLNNSAKLREFHEGSFTLSELKEQVEQYLEY